MKYQTTKQLNEMGSSHLIRKIKNKRVYISLPIGEDKSFQAKQEAFSWEIVDRLAKRGYTGINPFHHNLGQSATRKQLLRLDFQKLLECDTVLLCPGYECSQGCQMELALATWSGIEVVRYKDFPW